MPFKTNAFEKIKQMKQTISALKGKSVATGFFQESKSGNEITNAEKAIKNNFGIGVPKRPFWTTTKDNEQKKHANAIAKDSIKAVLTSNASIAINAMEREGEQYKKEFRQAIIDWSVPSNSPATIQAKGFNDPLVDTGEMRDSVDSKIVKIVGTSNGDSL